MLKSSEKDFVFLFRQGHLSMVILLLNCGADPTLIDGEGYSSIHLAVVFQHMPIIAYLISKGQVCFSYAADIPNVVSYLVVSFANTFYRYWFLFFK